MKGIKFIEDLDLEGRRVLTRLDLNVPLNNNGQITDESRIKSSLKTIRYIIDKGGKAILMSHLGRPDGERMENMSLKPVSEALSENLGKNVIFAPDCVGNKVEKIIHQLRNGEVVLLENLRFHKAETANDIIFSKKLAKLGDIYINDAFGSVHRSHSSTSGVPKFLSESAIGFLIKKELKFLGEIVSNAENPFLAIIGGAKVADKIKVIDKLFDKIQTLIIGGGMSCTFLKAQGFDIGDSLLEKNCLNFAQEIIKKSKEKKIDILLPNDAIIANSLEEDASVRYIKLKEGVPKGWMILDIGPLTSEIFSNAIGRSKTVLWNGPMGVFEIEKFSKGTFSIAKSLAKVTEKGTLSIVGGGDSVSAIKNLGFIDKISHVSTGGGASLEFLEGKELPGISSIKKH